jgi:hypothetical protein
MRKSNPQSRPSNNQLTRRQPNRLPGHKRAGGELVKETREAAGEDEEENANLKHAKPVQWLAR